MDVFSKKRITDVKDYNEQVVSFCVENNINMETSAFHLAGIKTFFARNSEEVSRDFFKDTYFHSIDVLHQTYTIDIINREYDFSKLAIKIDDDFLEADIVLEKGFFVDNDNIYKVHLLNFVLLLLIQRKIMITSVEQIKLRLEKILATLGAPCVLEHDVRHTLLKSKAKYKPRGFTNILEEKWCKENNKPPFHNAMYAVNVGDEIGFFLKEPLMINGRNLKGEFVDMSMTHVPPVKEPKKEETKVHREVTNAHAQETRHDVEASRYNNPPEVLGNGIKREEEGMAVKYESDGNGFVAFRDNGIELIDIATFEQVGAKTTGCMLGGLQKAAEIDIECSDNSKDALQSGTVLEAEVVNIKGNVGENTVIRAKRLSIKGQTHQSALIYADDAYISIHKGTLNAKEADVEILEAGRVNATYANILDLQGGKVVANKVVITRLHSHSNVDFCESLHLKTVEGGENKINFDVFADSAKKSQMLSLIMRNDLLKERIKFRVQQYKMLAQRLYKIKPIVDNLKPIVIQSKKEGFQLDKEIKKTISYYVNLLKHIKVQKESVMNFQQERLDGAKTAKDIENELLKAKITTEASWRDNNQIIITRHFPSDTVSSIFMQDSDMLDVIIDDEGNIKTIDQE